VNYGYLLAWLGLLAVPALAAESIPKPHPPILQLDTGGHMAAINDIAFTQDQQYLVSASDDKVVRIWDLSSGTTTRTLRGEIDAGEAGKIFAMALSPDERWLAVAGYMATYTGDNAAAVGAIRLYDFASGELTALLKGHRNVVFDLAFSPDSRHLASASPDNTAIVWDLANRTPLHHLRGHDGHVKAVAFTPDGKRLVSASSDGSLGLWNVTDGKLIERLQGHQGAVNVLAISPADGTIASAGQDRGIRLWNGQNGQYLRTLAKPIARPTSLSFSPDGRHLLAALKGKDDYSCPVYRLTDGTLLANYANHDNTVPATAISPAGQWAASAGGSHQDIHLWSLRDGRFQQHLGGAGARVVAVGFASDGSRVAWGKTLDPQSDNRRGPLEYVLRLPGQGDMLGYPAPLSNSRGFQRVRFERARTQVENWQLVPLSNANGDYNAILEIRDGAKTMATIERTAKTGYRHRSYTFTPDGKIVISGGSNGVLSAYARTGERLGDFIGHTGEVWAVAVSPDGRLLVSGSQDRTVRLWNVASRELLLTVFHGATGRDQALPDLSESVAAGNLIPAGNDEWVMWTPSGYYNTSARGDRYVGWHRNRGAAQAADYFPAARFASRLYQPEVVNNTLEFGSEARALEHLPKNQSVQAEQSAAELIAQVPGAPRLLGVLDHTVSEPHQTLAVCVDERTEKLFITVNARPVQGGRSLLRGLTRKKDCERQLTETVELTRGENRVEILARNQYGDSPKIQLTVNYQAPADADWHKPSLYLLAVGVSDYADSALTLDFAHRDAERLAQRLQQESGNLYREVNTKVLVNQAATRGEILDALHGFLRQMTQDDLAVLFIAGHGMNDDGGDYYFLPRDVDPTRLYATAIPWRQFQQVTTGLPGKVILLADTCHSGGIYGQRGRRAVLDMTQLAKEFADADNGTIVITSSTGREYSLERPEWQHGAFTKALLDGLAGGADFAPDTVIHLSELELYVKRAVSELTEGRQHPISIRPDAIADFPLAVVP